MEVVKVDPVDKSDHSKLPEPLAVIVVLCPLQIAKFPDVETVGAVPKLVMVKVSNELPHPLVAVTEYAPAVDVVNVEPTELSDHVNVPVPEAVMVVDSPVQISKSPETDTTGSVPVFVTTELKISL